MTVWVRLRVGVDPGRSSTPRLTELHALVNTGYGSRDPQLIVSSIEAGDLGLWPPPPDTVRVTYGSLAGPVSVSRIPRAVRVTVLQPDRQVGPVLADLVISPHERRLLLSDALASGLLIAVLDPAQGIWAFRDQLHVERASEPAPAARPPSP